MKHTKELTPDLEAFLLVHKVRQQLPTLIAVGQARLWHVALLTRIRNRILTEAIRRVYGY